VRRPAEDWNTPAEPAMTGPGPADGPADAQTTVMCDITKVLDGCLYHVTARASGTIGTSADAAAWAAPSGPARDEPLQPSTRWQQSPQGT
jgi:hypothetical protein